MVRGVSLPICTTCRRHALSVARQGNGPHIDAPAVRSPDGTWSCVSKIEPRG